MKWLVDIKVTNPWISLAILNEVSKGNIRLYYKDVLDGTLYSRMSNI